MWGTCSFCEVQPCTANTYVCVLHLSSMTSRGHIGLICVYYHSSLVKETVEKKAKKYRCFFVKKDFIETELFHTSLQKSADWLIFSIILCPPATFSGKWTWFGLLLQFCCQFFCRNLKMNWCHLYFLCYCEPLPISGETVFTDLPFRLFFCGTWQIDIFADCLVEDIYNIKNKQQPGKLIYIGTVLLFYCRTVIDFPGCWLAVLQIIETGKTVHIIFKSSSIALCILMHMEAYLVF